MGHDTENDTTSTLPGTNYGTIDIDCDNDNGSTNITPPPPPTHPPTHTPTHPHTHTHRQWYNFYAVRCLAEYHDYHIHSISWKQWFRKQHVKQNINIIVFNQWRGQIPKWVYTSRFLKWYSIWPYSPAICRTTRIMSQHSKYLIIITSYFSYKLAVLDKYKI